MKEKGADESEGQEVGLITCVRVEGVHGVLTLFCSGAAQVVCHALRVGELREQLEVEEEEGDRQEEGGRSRERRGSNQKETTTAHRDDHG